MNIQIISREALRDKARNCLDMYLGISDKHRVSIGIYYHGQMYMLQQQYRDSDFQFDIGSISKTMTAHLVLKLVEQGKLELEKSIDYYLPLKKGSYPTLYELLTHTAGYHHLTPLEITAPNLIKHRYVRKNVYEKCTSEMVKRCLQRRRFHKKGHPFGYSDFAYAVLAIVVEGVLQRPFPEIFEEFVQNDLGLKNTVLSVDTMEREPKSVHSKKYINFWRWTKRNPYVASGGLVTNMEDMLKYIDLQVTSECPYIVKAHKLCEASVSDKTKDAMCIGWRTYKNSNQLWHVGGVGSFRSSVIINKHRRIGVCVMGNAKGVFSANVHFLAKMIYSELKIKKIRFEAGN